MMADGSALHHSSPRQALIDGLVWRQQVLGIVAQLQAVVEPEAAKRREGQCLDDRTVGFD